jgi:hypothetical protein
MQLPSHGRCGHSAIVNRPDYSWPEGKRLAIYVAAALEHFAFGRGIGHPEGTAALSKHKDLVAVADRAVTLTADSFYRSNRLRRLLTRHCKISYSDFREAFSDRFGEPFSISRPVLPSGTEGEDICTVATVLVRRRDGFMDIATLPCSVPSLARYTLTPRN